MKMALVGIGALVAMFLFYGILNGSTPQGSARIGDRLALEECRKTVDDPLLDVSARLMARGACEQMEARFRLKHGYAP